MPSSAARDISYAHSARTRAGRIVIRAMENSTGRLRLIRRARGYETDMAGGQGFWDVMVARYGLSLDIVSGGLEHIPASGPVIVIANHPYGILDGMMLGHILSAARGDFRILANRVFGAADALQSAILPISFDQTKQAVAMNLKTRNAALSYLGEGGAIGIFPGGTVSTAATPLGCPLDPGWRTFTAKLVAKSGARVVPVYFGGHTSRLFQIASHVHPTLRMGLLIQEFKKRTDTPVRVAIGAPLDPAELEARRKDPRAMMDFLRRSTYELAPEPRIRAQCAALGHDFG